MAIHHQCACGAKIRMRDSAAGKQAKCSTCGAVFTVPEPEGKSYGWLEEFSKSETQAPSESLPAPAIVTESDAIDLSEPEVPATRPTEDAYLSPDQDHEWVLGPARPFWRDLVESFIFFLDPSSLVTFLVLAFVPILLSFIPVVGVAFNFVISFYIVAFYMETVREAASGSDQLPEIIWITSWPDLLEPLFQFLGTILWVFLPAIGLAGYTWHETGQVAWRETAATAGLGLLFWPVVLLQVAIGGRLRGLWPHTTIRTALSAPVGYLAVCLAILAAAAVRVFPYTGWFKQLVSASGPIGNTAGVIVVVQLSGMYAMIVAMRAIGLFYRHFKHRFPWVAE